jgi:hypothetical protein
MATESVGISDPGGKAPPRPTTIPPPFFFLLPTIADTCRQIE